MPISTLFHFIEVDTRSYLILPGGEKIASGLVYTAEGASTVIDYGCNFAKSTIEPAQDDILAESEQLIETMKTVEYVSEKVVVVSDFIGKIK